MSPVAFFSPHHDPHRDPLCMIDRFDDSGDFVDERDGTRDVVQNWDFAYLFPESPNDVSGNATFINFRHALQVPRDDISVSQWFEWITYKS